MKAFLKKIFGKENEKQKESAKETMPMQEKSSAVDDFDCDPDTFHYILQKKPTVKLIDVRTKEEYESGHISGAALLPVQELSEERIDALGVKKDDDILLY
ncbi:rhodanese-like domain-containing protein [Candidatus Woesearchaeota archaeon]|nr:rhodanese-like domain-containing protein [Candidatus Woesearchaeota archaeon]